MQDAERRVVGPAITMIWLSGHTAEDSQAKRRYFATLGVAMYRDGWLSASCPALSHGCPVQEVLAWAHGVDSTRVLSLATHRDRERIKAVRHRNSVFHDILKLVPWTAFDRLVEAHGTDASARSFTSRQHLSALLFAQLSGAGSLREMEETMASHQGRLYHSGAVAPKRSTFADANRAPDFRVFTGLFETMLAHAGRGARRKIADAGRLIDSTGLRLSGVGAEWARFSTSVFGQGACCLRS